MPGKFDKIKNLFSKKGLNKSFGKKEGFTRPEGWKKDLKVDPDTETEKEAVDRRNREYEEMWKKRKEEEEEEEDDKNIFGF